MSRGLGDLSSGVANKKKSAIPDSSRTNYQKEKGQVENLSRFHPGTKLFKISKVDSSSTKKLHPFWTESILEKPKNLLTCTISDCENLALDSSILVSNPSGLGSDSSNSVLDPSDVILGLSKSAKRLPEGS